MGRSRAARARPAERKAGEQGQAAHGLEPDARFRVDHALGQERPRIGQPRLPERDDPRGRGPDSWRRCE